MSATVLEIVEKVIPNPLYPSLPSNFVLREGESIAAQIVVENPNVSLYCLDDENKRALFVQTKPGTDLIHAPFYYIPQYEQAERVIAVPYEELHALADAYPAGEVAFIQSVGRCGSTLISSALNEVDGVISLSEPDVYVNITMMRTADRMGGVNRDAEYLRLLRSCTRLISRKDALTVIKFRAACIHIGDLLYQVFPEAKSLFLYRNAEMWAQSMTAAFGTDATPILSDPNFMLFLMSHSPLALPFIMQQGRQPEWAEGIALVWLSILDSYLKLRAEGVSFLAVRYEDIVKHPKSVLGAIFDYLGMPESSIEAAYGTFSKDSQEGTLVSRDNVEHGGGARLTTEQLAQIRAVLQEHPTIQSPDIIVPDTVTFDMGTTSAI